MVAIVGCSLLGLIRRLDDLERLVDGGGTARRRRADVDLA